MRSRATLARSKRERQTFADHRAHHLTATGAEGHAARQRDRRFLRFSAGRDTLCRMRSRLVLGAIAAFVVIFNLGYVFHEIVAADFLKAGFGPGVQRAEYNIPVIAVAFSIYVTLMAAVYPVFYAFFSGGRGWSRVATGALLGLFCGFLWDALQGGIIEYATYNVSLHAMLLDSAYHTAEGVLAGVIIGVLYRPAQGAAK